MKELSVILINSKHSGPVGFTPILYSTITHYQQHHEIVLIQVLFLRKNKTKATLLGWGEGQMRQSEDAPTWAMAWSSVSSLLPTLCTLRVSFWCASALYLAPPSDHGPLKAGRDGPTGPLALADDGH